MSRLLSLRQLYMRRQLFCPSFAVLYGVCNINTLFRNFMAEVVFGDNLVNSRRNFVYVEDPFG